MRFIDPRIPLLAGVAVILLAVSPAHAAIDAPEIHPEILFVSGTGQGSEAVQPETQETAQSNDDISDAQAELTDLSAKMADPRLQDSMANAVERITETMLDLPIGQFAASIKQSFPGANKGRDRIRADDTLADVAGPDADRLPEQLASGSRQMMGMMSGLAAAFATMLPEFEKMGKAMEESLEDFDGALPED